MGVRMPMRTHLRKLPARIWALAIVPAVLVAYPIGRAVVPLLVHAIVPDVVRNALHVM